VLSVGQSALVLSTSQQLASWQSALAKQNNIASVFQLARASDILENHCDTKRNDTKRKTFGKCFRNFLRKCRGLFGRVEICYIDTFIQRTLEISNRE
jgi:hypothetical protein